MLLELFPFVILNNVMAFIYAYFFSDFLRFDMSLLLLTVTLRGVSNKHCLLSLFSLSLFHISLAAAVHLSATTNFLVSYGSLTVL